MVYKDMAKLKQIIELGCPHYHKNFPLIFFWSPKSGCTSLVKWFFFQIGMLDKAIKYDPWVHKYEFEVYKNDQNYIVEVLNKILDSEKEVFKLVRNPYRRAVSSFLFLISPVENYFFRELEEIRFIFCKDTNSNKGISFKQFLYYLKKKGPYVGTIDGHLAQQYIEDEELLIRNYIYLENFNDQISEIEERYGLAKSPLEIITKSNHYFSSLMTLTGDHSETAFTELNVPLPTYQSFYDKETKDLVEEVFKKDFEVYGYKNADSL